MASNPTSISAGPVSQDRLRVLSRGDVEAFRSDGYVFPLRALDIEQTNRYRAGLESAEARVGGTLRASMRSKPHLFLAWAAELIRCPAILDAVEDLYGPNLLCWSSSFFVKDARDPGFVSWHQDSTYWGLSHPDVVTAWVALSPSDTYNGCMRVIPGTHLRDQLPHRDTFAPNNLLTRGQEVEVAVDEHDAVNVVLQPGEFSLHHVRLVHGSDPNRSDVRRIGFAIRYIPTYVRQMVGQRDTATLVRGVDDYGHFDPEPRPTEDFAADAMAFHRRVVEETNAVLYRGTAKRNPL